MYLSLSFAGFRRVLPLALTLALSVVGCSSSPKTVAPSGPIGGKTAQANQGNDQAEPAKKVKTKKMRVDSSKPATYAEYKQWREANDPGGQVYAEYKEWEAAYKLWQSQQNQLLKQQ